MYTVAKTYPAQEKLIVVSKNGMMSRYTIQANMRLRLSMKGKIGGSAANPQYIWATSGLLAATNAEPFVRMLSVRSEENYQLEIPYNGNNQ